MAGHAKRVPEKKEALKAAEAALLERIKSLPLSLDAKQQTILAQQIQASFHRQSDEIVQKFDLLSQTLCDAEPRGLLVDSCLQFYGKHATGGSPRVMSGLKTLAAHFPDQFSEAHPRHAQTLLDIVDYYVDKHWFRQRGKNGGRLIEETSALYAALEENKILRFYLKLRAPLILNEWYYDRLLHKRSSPDYSHFRDRLPSFAKRPFHARKKAITSSRPDR